MTSLEGRWRDRRGDQRKRWSGISWRSRSWMTVVDRCFPWRVVRTWHCKGGWFSCSVLVALVLAVSLQWRERALLPGIHPLAVGHPAGSGREPMGEGGAPCRL